jgi:hypothetical protein
MKKMMVVIGVFIVLTTLFIGFGVLNNNPSCWSILGCSNHTVKWIDATIPAKNLQFNVLGLSNGITVHAIAPDYPPSVRLYKGTLLSGDTIDISLGNPMSARNNVTSEEEAPEVAEVAMQPYGGLPLDAIFSYAETRYLKKISDNTGEVLGKWPTSTGVAYHRHMMGMPIVGAGDIIHVDLGENGEVLGIFKVWRTIEYTGSNISIITPEKATEKLQNGETLNHYLSAEGIMIQKITLGFYEKSMTDPQIFLEPVWIFSGKTPSGDSINLYIYARQFANFTATPTHGRAPLTVTFTDISDASPTKWNWDFGDGTTSTDQNPVHTFQTVGAYTVTLKAWNDLGSDTMVKTSFILTGKRAIVMHIDTKLDELRNTLNAMNVPKGNKNSLIQKLENAQKKNGDALKFIYQNKETQANNMLNAEDNLMNAFINGVNAQAGKSISTVDAAMLNDGATEIREFIRKASETPI